MKKVKFTISDTTEFLLVGSFSSAFIGLFMLLTSLILAIEAEKSLAVQLGLIFTFFPITISLPFVLQDYFKYKDKLKILEDKKKKEELDLAQKLHKNDFKSCHTIK